MTGAPVASLLRRAGGWLVEPRAADSDAPGAAHERARRRFPLVAVVGLARRCGATTLARALAAELAVRERGAAVAASPARPAVAALGSSAAAVRLAESLVQLEARRAAGRLCIATCGDARELAALTCELAPAVIEVEPGCAALDAAGAVDRVVLVASPALEPSLAAAVAETIATIAPAPLVAVNQAPDHGPWLVQADVLVPASRVAARLALAGREAPGAFGRTVRQLADRCAGD